MGATHNTSASWTFVRTDANLTALRKPRNAKCGFADLAIPTKKPMN
jgi:hypothetical protein